MGLLDSLVGSVVGNMLGGGQSGGGTQAELIQAIIGMLMNGGAGQAGGNSAAGAAGALGGLLEQFQRNGLGDVAASWVSTGQNLPISADQITQVLGPNILGQLAQSAGMDHGTAAGHLTQILPQLVDAVTPNGQLPSSNADLGSMLPQILGTLMASR